MLIFEGFVIGLVGSLHCVGMCGPLVLALPLSNATNSQRLVGGILYNFGRAITYALLGVIFGLLGQGLKLGGLQQGVSIGFGTLMILLVIIPGFINVSPLVSKITRLGTGPLKQRMGGLLQQKRVFPLFIFGLLNGLLPCGLVYMAIAGAIVSSSIMESSMYMFLFGIGTLPLMFMLIYFSAVIKSKFLSKAKRLIPVFIILLGILFILRGLNLGIPYISPNMDKRMHHSEEMKCH